jgi:putative ABC transport system substrate-binding protein
MKRREFMFALGGAAVWPLSAAAQQPAIPVVGFMNGQKAADVAHFVAAFRGALQAAGFTECRNVVTDTPMAVVRSCPS